ncbi:MAG: DNA repair protein RecO [Myxococcota bacterium]
MSELRLKSEAVLLRAVDVGESDRIVHLLVPGRGRLTAIAKGARRSVRRFAGTLDLCNVLRVHVERRGQRAPHAMARLEQATLVDAHLGLRAMPARFALACYVVEVVDRMAPEGGVASDLRRLYDFTRRMLAAIEHAVPDERLRLWVELRALDALGLRPELRVCVACGRPPAAGAKVGFRVADGGVLCGACALRSDGLVPLHLGTVKTLERVLALPLEGLGRLAIPKATLDEARAVVARFQRFHVGIEIRSERVLDGLLRAPARAASSA